MLPAYHSSWLYFQFLSSPFLAWYFTQYACISVRLFWLRRAYPTFSRMLLLRTERSDSERLAPLLNLDCLLFQFVYLMTSLNA